MGGVLTQPPPRGLPLGNGPTAYSMLRVLSGRLCCSCLGGIYLDVCPFLGAHLSGSLLAVRTGKELGLYLLGCFGTTLPWGVSPEEQGGPWAPPPCGDKSSETLLGLGLVYPLIQKDYRQEKIIFELFSGALQENPVRAPGAITGGALTRQGPIQETIFGELLFRGLYRKIL